MQERTHKVTVRLTDEEYARLLAKMDEVGVGSMSMYIRKMMLDGYCVRLKTDDFSEIVYLLRMCSNNLNQYAKKANTTGSIYKEDIQKLQSQQKEIWNEMGNIVSRLANIQ